MLSAFSPLLTVAPPLVKRNASTSTKGGGFAPEEANECVRAAETKERGDASTTRLLAGVDDAAVQRRRQQVLAAGADDVAALADAADALAARGRTVVVASADTLADAHRAARARGEPGFTLLHPLAQKAA